MFGSRQLGKEGEDRGLRYLKSLGYKILTRNFRSNFGEIDIIAKDKHTLVFIEVKTRSNNSFGHPHESVTKWKLSHLIKTCQYYCLLNKCEESPQRIDVLSLEDDNIVHFKNVTL
jgi:putative endonuclease